ncbi:Protein CSF1 [Nakaseomyces bracarensis]|uniref:Protein CSF1 n=1 Tax=Nakaseomyces bracarensis TaxID=273131 RepID=A0ABR4NXJ4_9SACH
MVNSPSAEFENKSITHSKDFSWVFLVVWVLLDIVALTDIFYISRYFGYLLTKLLGYIIWKRKRVKVTIGSINVSLLAGRIFIKEVTLMDKDKLISIAEGTITWRYWLHKARKSEYMMAQDIRNSSNNSNTSNSGTGSNGASDMFADEIKAESNMKQMKLPCKLLIEVSGLEIFFYNRTVAYDNIVNVLSKVEREKFEKFMNDNNFTDSNSEGSTDEKLDESSLLSNSTETESVSNDRSFSPDTFRGLPKPLRALPIQLYINKCSVLLGNKFTPSVMLIGFDNADALIDVAEAPSKLDLFRIKFQFAFKNFKIQMKTNINFDSNANTTSKFNNEKISRLWRRFTRVLRFIYPRHKRRTRTNENEKFMHKWKGLSMYRGQMFGDIDDMDVVDFDISSHEYAKFSDILKSPRVVVNHEYDVVGWVPHGAHPPVSDTDGPDVGNNGAPPQHIFEINIFGGTICYGPWAQRQISHIQTLLSPVVSRDAKPTKKLRPGSRRIYTFLRFAVNATDDVTWRIPTRESSKDVEFLKNYKETNDDYRPFGWIDVKFSRDSSAVFDLALCPTINGFKNSIDIQLKDTEIRSSVNHDIFLKSKLFEFNCDISYPLGWNAEATWTIIMNSSQLELFLLREHVTLIADTLTDFSSGEPTPYELFRPFVYIIKWNMKGYSFYLNVNDHNIVNNPLDFNENCYLSLHGDDLALNVTVPKKTITSRFTNISYELSTPMFRLLLNTPPWNTLNEFMRNKEVGRSYDFKINGSYLIYSELDIDNVDTLTVECTSRGTALHLYGFVIRYLTNVKMNYFGEFFHFVTSEEYTGNIQPNDLENIITQDKTEIESISTYESVSRISSSSTSTENINTKKQGLKRSDLKRTSNETDIWFTFSVWDGALILPETIYNADPCIVLHFGELIVDLRSCNYYMDILATTCDVSMKRYIGKRADEIYEYVHLNNGKDFEKHGSISDLYIHGHRMYGLPPTEPTYFCQWDMDLGHLKIDSNMFFLQGLFGAFYKIGFGYKDLENILLYETEIIDDMTSLTIFVNTIDIRLNDVDTTAHADLKLERLSFTVIDYENERYSKRMDIKIPFLEFYIFANEENDLCLFKFTVDMNFTNFVQTQDFNKHRKIQRDYIVLNDSPYHRCSFLLPESYQNSRIYNELYGAIAPSNSLPPLPMPLIAETMEYVMEDLLEDYMNLFEGKYEVGKRNGENLEVSAIKAFRAITGIGEELDYSISNTASHQAVESDNYVVKVESLIIDINPVLHITIEKLLNHIYDQDAVHIIDSIEIGIVKRLSNIQEGVTTMTNVKVQITHFNLFWGEKEGDSVSMYFDKLDFALAEKTLEQNSDKDMIEMTVLSKVKAVRLTVGQQPAHEISHERPPAVSVGVEGFEFWVSAQDKQVNSISVVSTDITVDDSQIEWLFKYTVRQKFFFLDMIKSFNRIQDNRMEAQKELISRLTAASEYYQISHDPYVITKPAFIMRLSRGHVRENKSWKIITRLRHILTYLPQDWYLNVGQPLKDRKFDPSQDARSIFMSIFSNWKNWEFSDVARSYIYGKLFLNDNPEQKKKILRKLFRMSVNNFFLTVYSTNYDVDHSIVVAKAKLLVDLTPPQTDGGVKEKLYDISGTVESIKGKVSTKLLKLHDLVPILTEDSTHSNISKKSHVEIPTPFIVNTALMVGTCDLQLAMDDTKLLLTVTDGRINVLWENLQDSTAEAGSIVVFAKKTEISLKHFSSVLAEGRISDFYGTFTVDTWAQRPTMLVYSRSSSMHFRTMTQTEVLVIAVRDITRKVNEIQQQLNLEERLSKPSSSFKPTKSNVIASCLFSNVSMDIMPISPFALKQNSRQIDFFYNKFDSNSWLINIRDTDFFFTSDQTKEQYLRLSIKKLQIRANVSSSQPKLVDIGVATNMVKLTFSEPKNIASSFLKDERVAIESINLLKKLKPLFFIDESDASSKESIDSTEKPPINWTVDLNLDYFGLLVPISSSYFVLEFHKLITSLTNTYDNNITEELDLSGHISIENILFLIKESSLPDGLSRMLDFSVKISTLQRTNDNSKSIQVESAHSRICLSPDSLVRLLWGSNHLSQICDYYLDHHSKSLWQTLFPKNKDEITNNDSLSILSSISSVHFLSYNFCIGWLFEYEIGAPKGLIAGYNRIFSAYEDDHGKLTVIDSYFAAAQGNTSSTFFPTTEVKDLFNRWYLPNMQIVYWWKIVENMRDVYVNFTGESLDVKYLSDFMLTIESALHSVKMFQKLKRELIITKPKRVTATPETTTNIESRSSSNSNNFLNTVRAVNCRFKYNGGTYSVYKLVEGTISPTPAIEVKSPVISVDLIYRHEEEKIKPHWIRCLINIDPTHNIFYASCASLIKDLVNDIQDLVGRYGSSNNKKKVEPSVSSGPGIDYDKLLGEYDLAVTVTSAKQQLSLSCEPKAKIQADVGFEALTISVGTNHLDSEEPLTLLFSLKDMKASIKHLFSRETSTSFGIGYVDLHMLFTHTDRIHTFGTSLISDIDVFFNVKQLQNLYVFLDVWQLNELLNPKTTGNAKEVEISKDLKSEKPVVQEAKTELPWCFTLIFTNVKGDIDLGPSLGLLGLRLKKTWIATDHYIDKRQILHAFIDELLITSEGRLSGIVNIDGASWVSEVSWVDGDKPNGIPLVALSVNTDKVEIKAAFDYHMFLIGTVNNVLFQLHSERDMIGNAPDLLKVALSCEEIKLCSTALVMANLYDIYNTIMRMRQDNRIGYIETMNDSSPEENNHPQAYRHILKSLKLLRTDLSIGICSLQLQISPISLFDVELIVINVVSVSARSETHSGNKLTTSLNMEVYDGTFSLCTTKQELDEDALVKISVADYMTYASKIKGSTIIEIPKMNVNMTTWQEEKSDILEYIFGCKFYDKVSVRWNFGAINFVKAMWNTNIKAIAVRKSQGLTSTSSRSTEEDVEERIKEEENISKWNYKAVEEPHIEKPQIRDLGEATPPVEWIGLKSKNLPIYTHEFAVTPVQKIVYVAQKQYAKTLGRSK